MGSKRALLPFIFDSISNIKCEAVLDAFAGTSAVAYRFKSLGKTVHANDFLSFSYHNAVSIVANNATKLSNLDVTRLLRKNPRAPSFVQDTFGDRYFTHKDNAFLDNLWANISAFRDSTKRSLALAAISRACMKKRPRGIFTFTGRKSWDGRRDLVLPLEDHFLLAIRALNSAVFSNGKNNRATNQDVFSVDPRGFDLVYFDTPYVSPYSDCDYVRRYHFVEGPTSSSYCNT